MPFIIALMLSMIIEPLVKFYKSSNETGHLGILSILIFLGGSVAFSIFAITRIVMS